MGNMNRGQNPQAALELLILKSLVHESNHGFGIAQHIEATSSALLRVEEGSLYPALHRLEKHGYIRADWQTTEAGRRARVYRLAPSGKRRLVQLEKSWTSLAAGVRRVLDSV